MVATHLLKVRIRLEYQSAEELTHEFFNSVLPSNVLPLFDMTNLRNLLVKSFADINDVTYHDR